MVHIKWRIISGRRIRLEQRPGNTRLYYRTNEGGGSTNQFLYLQNGLFLKLLLRDRNPAELSKEELAFT